MSVACFHLLEFGYSVNWKGLLLKLQKEALWLIDVTCNLLTSLNIPLNVGVTAVNFQGNTATSSMVQASLLDDKNARKQGRAMIMNVVKYESGEVSVKGNKTKAENAIKSLSFSSYEENNLCDLKEGIPGVEFDETVEEVAELTNMPKRLKRVVKRARNFMSGNVFAVKNLQFKTEDGSMVFGRIAVLRNGGTFDMAYSLHSVKYELKKKQSKPEIAGNFTKFSKTLYKANDVNDQGDEDDDDFNEISFDLRQGFLAFFHTQAIEGFEKHCDYLL